MSKLTLLYIAVKTSATNKGYLHKNISHDDLCCLETLYPSCI